MADASLRAAQDAAMIETIRKAPDEARRQILAAAKILLGRNPFENEDDWRIVEAARAAVAIYAPGRA